MTKYRVLIVASHPVQYAAPLFRLMAKHPQLNIQVAYCSLQGIQASYDAGFGVKVAWDIPLLDGYPWIEVKNSSPNPGLGKFWGLFNLELWKILAQEQFDAVIVYTGYAYASFWIAAAIAKVKGIKFIFSTDASTVTSRKQNKVKAFLKNLLLPLIFKTADIVIVSSTLGKQMVSSLGISEDRIALTPSTVDNNWWTQQASQVEVKTVRDQWNIPEDAKVILFCAKLQPWKRPQDVLKAFTQANLSKSYLLFVGEGPLRKELENAAEKLEIRDKVRFLGFANQSQLPSIYRSSDLFVLPSEYEPFGVVVNEAMLCGCPVVVSDKVGAAYDLVSHGENGFVYSCGNIDELANIFRENLFHDERLAKMRAASIKRMEAWSPTHNIDAIVQSLKSILPTNILQRS